MAAKRAKKSAAKKAAKAKASAKVPAKRPAKKAAKKVSPKTTPKRQVPVKVRADWVPVQPQEAWIPVASQAAQTAPAHIPFNPATGDWIPVSPQAQEANLLPEAPRSGSTSYVVWNVILGIDLALLALNFIGALVIGFILVFAPDSAQAQDLRDSFDVSSPGFLALETLLTFVLMGVVPFFWVLGTRRVAWEGTKRYLQLHKPLQGVLRGIALTPVLLIAVMALSSIYILITEGPDGFSLTGDEGENPAVDAILAQLTWPVAVVIALGAGVGEEILFRGVLQKRLGVWGQATLFGLAHAAGGYLPQVLFAFGLGVFFGFLLKRGWSLVTLMTAHFLYDMVLLSISLVYG